MTIYGREENTKVAFSYVYHLEVSLINLDVRYI